MSVRPLHRRRISFRSHDPHPQWFPQYGNGFYVTDDRCFAIRRQKTHTDNKWVERWKVEVYVTPFPLLSAVSATGILQALFERRSDAIGALEAILEELE